MSYKHVLQGDLTGVDDAISKLYLPDEFLKHQLLNKNGNIGYHIRVYNDTSVGMCLYIRGEYRGDDLKTNLDNCLAQVQYHIDYDNDDVDDDDITIKWVEVNSDSRGKGYATYLISLALIHSHIIGPSITVSKLDDASDAYANGISDVDERRRKQSKNLYIKMGYKYEDDAGGPEMLGDVETLISKIETSSKRKRGYIHEDEDAGEDAGEARGPEMRQDVETRTKRKRGALHKKRKKKKNKGTKKVSKKVSKKKGTKNKGTKKKGTK